MADPKKATEYRKINDELVQVWPETVTDNITVKNYTKPGSTAAIANNDLLNTALGKLEKALDGKATSNHSHGNITSDGKVGTTSGLPLITTTGGTVTTGSFGTTAGTFCQGNDSRLSDARTPTSHAHGNITNAGELGTASRVVITDANKKVTTSTITTTELGYLSGASSNLQTQINNINTSIAGGITIKGTIGISGTITSLPATHAVGDAYYAVAGAPQIGDYPTEVGDMIICITAGTSANNAHWSVIQNNTDTMVGATSSAAGKKGLVPAPAAGDQNKILAGNGTWVTNTGDTHHQAKNIIGNSASATADVSAATNNPYLNLVENGAVRSTVQLNGANSVSVQTSDDGKTVTFTGPAAATATPSAIGIAAVGSSSKYAKEDHVHALPTTGVTSGSYGPSADATPAYGATFNVPYITVDAQGRITAASTKTVTIPASDNTNTTYTLSTSTANNTVTITPSSGSVQTKDLPRWASYGTSLPDATAIAAMPDGALFLLLDA